MLFPALILDVTDEIVTVISDAVIAAPKRAAKIDVTDAAGLSGFRRGKHVGDYADAKHIGLIL